MAVIEGGTSAILAEVGAAAAKPIHVTSKPIDYGTLGHYRISRVTGVLAAALAANAVVFSFRWGDATRLCILTKLKARFLPLTPFTAATLTDHTSFDAFIGRSFTASHTGGTGITPAGNDAKMRTSMGTSLVTDVRIATTAALGGGTITVDASPFAQSIRKGNRVNPAAATEEVVMPTTDGMELDFFMADGDHPPVFAQNEGFVIRNRTVWPAAGTGQLMVTVAWAEVTAF